MFITKDTVKMNTVSSTRVPSPGASVPVDLGAPPSWHLDVFTNMGAPTNLTLLEFLWRLYHTGVID